MAKVTIGFAVVFIALGLIGFIGTGSQYPTALIPAVLGLLLGIFGALSLSPDAGRRKLFMHINVTLGLLGFLGTIPSVIEIVKMAMGKVLPHPIASEEKFATCVICLIFVAMCVRSFIEARRARTAEAEV